MRFAATEKRGYLHDLGLRFTPAVGWAERGGGRADGHGNSVSRFRLTWGTGLKVVRVFREPVLEGERRGLARFAFRHQVDELIVENDAVVGVRGTVLEPIDLPREGVRVLADDGGVLRTPGRGGRRHLRRPRPQFRPDQEQLAH